MSKITEKIAKLLALAESPYEEEAKAALMKTAGGAAIALTAGGVFVFQKIKKRR